MDLELLARLPFDEVPSYRKVKRFLLTKCCRVGDLSAALERDDDRTPLDLVSQIIDVTQQHLERARLVETEARLERQPRRAEAIFDAVDVGLVLLGTQGGGYVGPPLSASPRARVDSSAPRVRQLKGVAVGEQAWQVKLRRSGSGVQEPVAIDSNDPDWGSPSFSGRTPFTGPAAARPPASSTTGRRSGGRAPRTLTSRRRGVQ